MNLVLSMGKLANIKGGIYISAKPTKAVGATSLAPSIPRTFIYHSKGRDIMLNIGVNSTKTNTMVPQAITIGIKSINMLE
jgi:hypothetical protein